jgi:hypothetical protein
MDEPEVVDDVDEDLVMVDRSDCDSGVRYIRKRLRKMFAVDEEGEGSYTFMQYLKAQC